jgi:hypothetical protein
MKAQWLAVVALAAAACATPQYTVLGTGPTGMQMSATSQSWPTFDSWEPVEGASNDVAVIVAIEDYAFLPDVPGAIQNANDWENYFRKSRGMKEVYTLTDKSATAEEIDRFLEQAVANSKKDASVWFVFIGHGAALKDGSDGAIIGMDAQQTVTSIEARSLKRKEVIAALEKGNQARTLVVLDACFSGRDTDGKLLAEGTQPVVPVSSAPSVTQGTLIFSAAAGDQVAGQLPGAARPAFSYMLLGGLRGWAAPQGQEVSAGDLDTWLKQQFRQIKGRQQTPAVDGNPDLVLARASEVDPGVDKLMRGETTATTVVTTSGQGNRFDTGHLEFTQPADWAIGPVGMGVILSLTNMYGAGEIMVTRMAMAPNEGAAWIQGAHDPEFQASGIGHRKTYGPEKMTLGNATGVFSKYSDPDPNFRAVYAYFDTYQAGAVYRFSLKASDDEALDVALPTLTDLVSTSEFK